MLSGRAMARTGLQMKPTIPSPPIFCKAGFPQHRFKVGPSGGAFARVKFTDGALVVYIPLSRLPLSTVPSPLCVGSVNVFSRLQPKELPISKQQIGVIIVTALHIRQRVKSLHRATQSELIFPRPATKPLGSEGLSCVWRGYIIALVASALHSSFPRESLPGSCYTEIRPSHRKLAKVGSS